MPSRSLCRPFDHMAPREAYRELLGARKISMAPPFVHMYYDGEGAAELNVRTNLSTRDVVSAFDIASLSTPLTFPFSPQPPVACWFVFPSVLSFRVVFPVGW